MCSRRSPACCPARSRPRTRGGNSSTTALIWTSRCWRNSPPRKRSWRARFAVAETPDDGVPDGLARLHPGDACARAGPHPARTQRRRPHDGGAAYWKRWHCLDAAARCGEPVARDDRRGVHAGAACHVRLHRVRQEGPLATGSRRPGLRGGRMRLALDVLTIVAVSGGAFFFLAGTVGMLRFPDTLTRLHALTKADNLGVGLVVVGLLPQAAGPREAAELLGTWLLVLLSGSVVSQLVARTVFATDRLGDALARGPGPPR